MCFFQQIPSSLRSLCPIFVHVGPLAASRPYITFGAPPCPSCGPHPAQHGAPKRGGAKAVAFGRRIAKAAGGVLADLGSCSWEGIRTLGESLANGRYFGWTLFRNWVNTKSVNLGTSEEDKAREKMNKQKRAVGYVFRACWSLGNKGINFHEGSMLS